MRRSDLLALGFMTFALFLGAGNIIYPPTLGQHAGTQIIAATLGFLLTAVGLPLTTLIAMAKAGGSLQLTELLPKPWRQAFWTTLFLVIGPAFAIPRMAVVAYEMGLAPFTDAAPTWHLTLFSVVFYSLTFVLGVTPGTIVKMVGKLITPLLVLLLVAITVGLIFNPLGSLGLAEGAYRTAPFSEGVVQGYMTMDCIAALGFGAVIGQALRQLGITEPKQMARYTLYASLMAAAGLGLVYIMLIYLGATSLAVAPAAENGGQILALYVSALFGLPGKLALAAIITLACLTTSIGVSSACADYFKQQLPRLSYRQTLGLILFISAIVANIGLTQLIQVSVPAIVTLYPLAIALVIMGLLRQHMPTPHYCYRVTFAVVGAFALIDGANASGLLPTSIVEFLNLHLPLFHSGMGWLIPFIATLSVTWLYLLKSQRWTTQPE